jgi:hypothetical protein
MALRGSSRLGIVLVGVGTLLVLLALTVLPWFRTSPGFFASFFAGIDGKPKFIDVHDAIVRFQGVVTREGISPYVSYGAASVYFSWLGWLLLLAAAGFGGLSVSPVGVRFWTVRWLATVFSVSGIALTLSALSLVSFEGNPPANAQTPSFGEYLSNASIALWAVVAGYTLILAGSFVPHPDR